MNTNGGIPRAEEVIKVLRAYDDALASGEPLSGVDCQTLPPDMRSVLEEHLDCLHLLDELRQQSKTGQLAVARSGDRATTNKECATSETNPATTAKERATSDNDRATTEGDRATSEPGRITSEAGRTGSEDSGVAGTDERYTLTRLHAEGGIGQG